MKLRYLFVIFAFCLISDVNFAYDFKSIYKSNMIYYNFIPSERNAVEVTYNSGFSSYKGNLEIPATVEYNGNTYTVKGIGQYAFYYCNELMSITMPSTIKRILSDFDGDKRLENVSLNSHLEATCKMNSDNDIPYINEMNALLDRQKDPITNDGSIYSILPYDKYTNLAAAEKNGKWGIIDRIGNVIIPFMYDAFGGTSIATGEYKKEYIYNYIVSMEYNGKWGTVDLYNEPLLPFINNSKNDCFGTNSSDKKIIKEIKRNISLGVDYTKAMQKVYCATFECGAYLKNEMDHAIPKIENGRWGIASGEKWLTMPKYDSCIKIEGKNRFLVSLDNKYGLIDNDGHSVIFDCSYSLMDVHGLKTLIKDGIFTVILNNGSYLIDSENKPVFFDNVIYTGQNNDYSQLFYMEENNKWGLLSTEKGMLVDCIFDAIGPFNNNTADTYYGKYKGSIDIYGKEVNSIVNEMYDEACGMSDSNFSDKLALYNATIKMDDFCNEGYTAKCNNNIGVMYFNVKDYASAIQYFETAIKIDPNSVLYTKNLKNAKSNMRLDRLTKVLNVISVTLNNMATIQNGNSNSSDNINTNVTGEPYANAGNYTARYQIWQSAAQNQFSSLKNALQRPAEGSNLLLIQTLKRNIQNDQHNMAQIRSEASSHGITIQESTYESIGL